MLNQLGANFSSPNFGNSAQKLSCGSSRIVIECMGLDSFTCALNFKPCGFLGTGLYSSIAHSKNLDVKRMVVEAKAIPRTENAKVRNRRSRKKFNGTDIKPRLSVFCSEKQLYAMVVDDQNKKCLFYGSTLQKSIRKDASCTTVEAAERVGEKVIEACVDLDISEVFYDRNGLARGERIKAFETAIGRHGFLPR